MIIPPSVFFQKYLHFYCEHSWYYQPFVLDSSPWQVAKSSLQHQDKRHPLVVAVEHMISILAAEPGSNAAAIQLSVVQMGVIRGGQSIGLLHEAIRLENLDDNL